LPPQKRHFESLWPRWIWTGRFGRIAGVTSNGGHGHSDFIFAEIFEKIPQTKNVILVIKIVNIITLSPQNGVLSKKVRKIFLLLLRGWFASTLC